MTHGRFWQADRPKEGFYFYFWYVCLGFADAADLLQVWISIAWDGQKMPTTSID